MANYTKSFNFRNGVQVDDDNFLVNSLGLVGIGTSVPTQLLDVNGNINANGLVNAVNLRLTGISTLSETRVGTGITLDPTSGIITAVAFYGNGATLSNLPTSQWVDVDAGLGFTSIYAAGYVGVATNDPRFIFQVGGRPGVGDQKGVGFSSTGEVVISGVVTSYAGFSGPGLGITQLNANNVVVGTLSTTVLPRIPNSLLSRFIEVGILTATSGFIGNLTGNVFGNTNGNFVNAGIITASNMFLGNITGAAATITYINAGIISATGASGFTAFYGALTGEVYGNVNGTLVGVADSAKALTGGPNIVVNNAFTTSIVNQTTLVTGFTSITSAGLQVGTLGNYFTVTSSGAVGIGTSQPTTSNLQVRNNSPIVEVIGESGTASISIGQSVGVGNSVGVLRFGSSQGQLDLINRSPGNMNFVLHAGVGGINTSLGITTGGFVWRYGQTNSQIMYLDYSGKLSVGAYFDPVESLSVVGSSTVTTDAYVGNNLSVFGSVTILGFNNERITLGAGVSNVFNNSNIYTTSGFSTFFNVGINSNLLVSSLGRVGIGSTTPTVALDVSGGSANFRTVGIGTTSNPNASLVVSGGIVADGLGIGTATEPPGGLFIGGSTSYLDKATLQMSGVVILGDKDVKIGIGTTSNYGAVDFSAAGAGFTTIYGQFSQYMLVPIVTSYVRGGLSTQRGAVIYNSTTNKHQGWNGSAWFDFY